MMVMCRFAGVIIRMLPLRNFRARVHALSGDSELIVDIADVEVVMGTAPEPIRARVLAWTAAHREELLDSRTVMLNGSRPQPIAPLN